MKSKKKKNYSPVSQNWEEQTNIRDLLRFYITVHNHYFESKLYTVASFSSVNPSILFHLSGVGSWGQTDSNFQVSPQFLN